MNALCQWWGARARVYGRGGCGLRPPRPNVTRKCKRVAFLQLGFPMLMAFGCAPTPVDAGCPSELGPLRSRCLATASQAVKDHYDREPSDTLRDRYHRIRELLRASKDSTPRTLPPHFGADTQTHQGH